MGQLVRQSNLFAAEDWKVIYRSPVMQILDLMTLILLEYLR